MDELIEKYSSETNVDSDKKVLDDLDGDKSYLDTIIAFNII